MPGTAFPGRIKRAQRLRYVVRLDPDALAELFAKQPALHRYPKAMAGRVQDICRALVEHLMGAGVTHVAGGQEYLEVRPKLVRLDGKLGAVMPPGITTSESMMSIPASSAR